MKNKSTLRHLTVGGFLLLQLNVAFLPTSVRATEEPGVLDKTKAAVQETTEKVKEATKEAGESVQDATRAAGSSFENLWRRVDEAQLKNRNRDEIVAWVIMGVLVGALAGMMTSLKTTGLGKMGRLLLGLAGAFLGGLVVHLSRVDFGMGPVLIRYEELLFSLMGAIVLIVLGRLIRSGAKKKPSE